MTDTGTDYESMDKEQLKDEARARGLATSGSKAALLARLNGTQEPDDDGIDDDDEAAAQTDDDGLATVEDVTETGGVKAPFPAAVDDDYKAPPEPADVAGMASPGASFDSRAVAHQAQLRNDAKYHNEGGLPAEQARAAEARDTGEFDDANGEFPNEGYTESTLPVTNRAERRFSEWRDANPDATVIPPTLLPPAYQDPTIATPGLPGDLDNAAVEDQPALGQADDYAPEDTETYEDDPERVEA